MRRSVSCGGDPGGPCWRRPPLRGRGRRRRARPDRTNLSARPLTRRFITAMQLAAVRQREPDQPVVAAGHLLSHGRAVRLGAAEPGEVQRLLGRLAVAVDRHDVGQAHGVMARVVEPRAIGIGEVLDDRERSRVSREARKRKRTEILLEVAHQGVTDALAEQHPAADDHPADGSVGGDPQQHPDLGHPTHVVDAHRHGVDVDERHVRPHELQPLRRQPAGRRFGRRIHLAHWRAPEPPTCLTVSIER